MKLTKQSLNPAIRLARTYAAPAIKPEIEYDAESSTAAQRRQATTTTPSTPRPKPRRGPKALSLLRAQKLAEALSSVPTPSRVDIKLGGTASTPAPLPPTLADLEAKRPERPPTPVSAPGYEKRYARLYNNIEKAFNAKQILQFAPELGVKLRKGKGRGKEAAIKGVMKIWGWEDPQSSNVQELATKLKERDWNLTRAELWLIVRDSSCVRPALDQGVKFSIPPPTTIEGEARQVDTGMRMLRGHGSSTALSDLDQQIGHRRVLITQHTRLVKPGMTGLEKQQNVLATISNASGAYLEPILGGSIRISAIDALQASKATSLLDQHTSYSTAQSALPLNLLTPSPTLEMTLFPHIPSSISSIPWQSIDKLAHPLFRVRGVQPWETKVGMRSVAHQEERLGALSSYPVDKGQNAAESLALADRISESLRTGEGVRTVASFGHLLFSDPQYSASMLLPADRSRFTAEQIETSAINRSKPILLPSLPPALIHFPIDGPPRITRSLRYQSKLDPTQFCDITYSVPAPVSPPSDGLVEPVGSESSWHQELDDMMGRLEVEDEVEAVPEGLTPAAELAPTADVNDVLDMTAFEARIMQERAESFIMPDRPIDFTMTTSKPSTIEIDRIPEETLAFLHKPEGVAPANLELHGQTWTLFTAVQNVIAESIFTPTPSIDPASPSSTTEVTLRSIQSTDLTLGPERVVRYAELETSGEIPPLFWEQLANWTRAVAPGAGSLKNAVY